MLIPNKIDLHMSGEVVALLLEHARTLDKGFRAQLALSKAGADDHHIVTVTPDELTGLLESLPATLEALPDKKTRAPLELMFDNFAMFLDQAANGRELEDWDESADPPSDAELPLLKIAEARVHTPREELEGLTLHQARELVSADWLGTRSAVRISEELPYEFLLEKSDLFRNSMAMLLLLRKQHGTRKTAGGNLNRKFLKELADITSGQNAPAARKNPTEEDLPGVFEVRHILQFCNFIEDHGTKFRLTRAGERMSEPEAAGELFSRLVRAYLREFNFAVLDPLVECPEIDDNVGYSLYVLSQHARDPAPFLEIMPRLFMPGTFSDFPDVDKIGESDVAAVLGLTRLIRPLMTLGVLTVLPNDSPEDTSDGLPDKHHLQITELFDRLFSFHISES